MLSLLQILLKILGIILLSIVGILLVLLLLVLFVPVRYSGKGSYKEEFICYGKVTWLFHLLSVTIDYEKELHTKIKIFGIPLSVFQRKKDKESHTDIHTTTDNEEQTDKETIPPKAVKEENSNSEPAKAEVPDAVEVLEEEPQTEEKKSFIQKIKNAIQKVMDTIFRIWNRICKGIRSVKETKDTVLYYISILQREEVKKAFALCKKRLGIMLKHILPRKMKVISAFGFDDPATTGYVLALHALLPVSVGKKIVLQPDFERSFFECEFKIKGAVNAWSLLHQLLCIILDKNCRALYQIVKKEIVNERK